MQMRYLPHDPDHRPSLLRKSVTVVATVALAGVALMLSAVLLTTLLVIGAMAGVFLWWKTRGLRRQMREQMRDFPPRYTNMEREAFRGEVIEGEAVRVDAKRDTP